MKKLFFMLTILLAFTLSCEENDCEQPALCTLLSSSDMGKTAENPFIWICHDGYDLKIEKKDLQFHLDHGDLEGKCEVLSDGLEFKDGHVVKIDCGYELPFIHTTANGTQWLYESTK